ncbi:RNA exonuclease 1 homolog [Symsagittifera roscoffensis]|uniref:RNA exonuclease 1 homolog n=1 Tax=Symsagittifera roscoffensis TaxID=84072 RepID=UPI00307CA169
MFQVSNSLDFITCPFVRKDEICNRAHCVFSHRKTANSSDKTKTSAAFKSPLRSEKSISSNIRRNDLEYDPVDNYAVNGLSSAKTASTNYLAKCHKKPLVIEQQSDFLHNNAGKEKLDYLNGNVDSNNVAKKPEGKTKTCGKKSKLKTSTENVLKKSSTESAKNTATKMVKQVQVKRKLVSEVDFLSMEEGGLDLPKKKKLPANKSVNGKQQAKSSVELEKIDLTEDIESPEELEISNVAHNDSPKGNITTSTCNRRVEIPFPQVEVRKQSPGTPYDLMQQRLQLLGQLKASLTKPNKSSNGAKISVPSADIITKSSTVASEVSKESALAIINSVPISKSRVAHQPKEEIADNRQVLLNTGCTSGQSAAKAPTIDPKTHSSKIPLIIRQQYLNKFFDHYQRLTSDSDAHTKSAEAEKSIYDRTNSKTVYMSSCVNALKRLANMSSAEFLAQSESSKSSAIDKPASSLSSTSLSKTKSLSHNQVLFGSKYSFVSQNTRNSGSSQRNCLSGEEFHKLCEKLCLSSDELKIHGFPGFGESKRKCFLVNDLEKVGVNDIEERICSRCGKSYSVYAISGSPVSANCESVECVYHWGKLWYQRTSMDQRFNCCQGDVSSIGCCISKGHVVDRTVVLKKEFIPTSDRKNGETDSDGIHTELHSTFDKSVSQEGSFSNKSVYAIDCEMCYTTMGIELTRVSVVNDKNDVCYDKLVKPKFPVVDYNTRFSGITEAMLKNVSTTLSIVQKDLLKLFSGSTILVGHSLESDLFALQLIHEKVIDTSVLFPHKMGLPYKRSLKNLALEYVGKIIQESADGHDSNEDAQTCISLLKYKLKTTSVRT